MDECRKKCREENGRKTTGERNRFRKTRVGKGRAPKTGAKGDKEEWEHRGQRGRREIRKRKEEPVRNEN